MLSSEKYINLLTTLHWGQIIKFKWYFEECLHEPLFLASFDELEVVDKSFMLFDVQTLFTMYFQEGQQNVLTDNIPLVEIYKKAGNQYIALRKIIREEDMHFPSVKELRKIKTFSGKEFFEV
ncbi:MAG: hypothetical protein ACOC4B_03195 [Bacteroidota bacterium]